jgi:zinc transport system substrate-binding protein
VDPVAAPVTVAVSHPVIASMVYSAVPRGCPLETLVLNVQSGGHQFEILPKILTALNQAPLLLLVGFPMDHWLRVRVRADTAVVSMASLGAYSETLQPGQPLPDPHFWLDPRRVFSVLANLHLLLKEWGGPGCQALPGGGSGWAQSLETLDQATRQALAPFHKRRVFASHDAFSFFVWYLKQLGVEVTYVAFEFGHVGAQQLDQVVQELESGSALLWDIPPYPMCQRLSSSVACYRLDPLGVTSLTEEMKGGYEVFFKNFLKGFQLP